jgi:hypothetical protein
MGDPALKARGAKPTQENLLQYLTGRIEVPIDHFVQVYGVIDSSERESPIIVAPAQRQIVWKLLWPLRCAKTTFMLGDFVGTIALCGMVAEMVAILRFEIEGDQAGAEKRISLAEFESKGQQRRVAILVDDGLLRESERLLFEKILTTRRRHLHIFSKDEADPAGDASNCYKCACGLVSWIIGNQYQDADPKISTALMDWLDRQGLLHDSLTDEDIERMRQQRT